MSLDVRVPAPFHFRTYCGHTDDAYRPRKFPSAGLAGYKMPPLRVESSALLRHASLVPAQVVDLPPRPVLRIDLLPRTHAQCAPPPHRVPAPPQLGTTLSLVLVERPMYARLLHRAHLLMSP